MNTSLRRIVLFDAACGLCTKSVRFILRRDPCRHFVFAALQSDMAHDLMRSAGVEPGDLSSLILIVHGKAYRESSAALRIAMGLRFPWPLCTVLLAVPPFLRNAAYRLVARNRSRCPLPSPEESPLPEKWKDRFLDNENGLSQGG